MKKIFTKSLLILSSLLILTQVSFSQVWSDSKGDYDQDLNSSCVEIKNNLKYRSKDSNTNNEVSDLQSFLQEKDFLSTEPTGYFGKATEDAVKKYQISKGLTGTGYVGKLTREKIKLDTCRDYALQQGIKVSLFPNSVKEDTVTLGQKLARLADFNFSGNGDIYTLNFTREGVSNNSILYNVYLYSGSDLLAGPVQAYSDGSIVFKSQKALFSVSGEKTISIKADISNEERNASSVLLTLTGYSTGLGFTSSLIAGPTIYISQPQQVIAATSSDYNKIGKYCAKDVVNSYNFGEVNMCVCPEGTVKTNNTGFYKNISYTCSTAAPEQNLQQRCKINSEFTDENNCSCPGGYIKRDITNWWISKRPSYRCVNYGQNIVPASDADSSYSYSGGGSGGN